MPTRFVNLSGRAAVVVGGRAVDLERGSEGALPSDPMLALARWDEVCAFAAELDPADGVAYEKTALGPPVPRPSKIFGVGLNYRDHAEEAGLDIPPVPLIFTKFPSCIVGPTADIVLTGETVDYEVEVVAVIGRGGRNVSRERAMEHVAGYCVGQDVSDRRVQFAGRPPQFSMGKSADSFGPIGPAVVSLEAFPNPDDVPLQCEVNGETRQKGQSGEMIFSVAELVEYLSRFCTLLPGDLIFTGTPAGVGSVRKPPVFLRPGDVLTSSVDGVGLLRNRCVGS